MMETSSHSILHYSTTAPERVGAAQGKAADYQGGNGVTAHTPSGAVTLGLPAVTPAQGEGSVPHPPGGGMGGFPPYLDLLAKTITGVTEPKKCPGWAILGECEKGHRWAKELVCGAEWCSNCGEEWSAAHQRRFARWLPKIQQIKTLGYLVVTVPPEMRLLSGWFHSKPGLRAATNRAVEVLGGKHTRKGRAGGYFKRGLLRWHYFGEQAGVWHPHLNVLVDGGRLPRGILKALRVAFRVAWRLPREPVVNYQFTSKPGKMVHILKYVTRATFRDYKWDEYMAGQLFDYRNARWWGKWGDPLVWEFEGEGAPELEAVSSLESGLCPKCGLPLTWSRPFPIVWLEVLKAKPIGGGYYQIDDS